MSGPAADSEKLEGLRQLVYTVLGPAVAKLEKTMPDFSETLTALSDQRSDVTRAAGDEAGDDIARVEDLLPSAAALQAVANLAQAATQAAITDLPAVTRALKAAGTAFDQAATAQGAVIDAAVGALRANSLPALSQAQEDLGAAFAAIASADVPRYRELFEAAESEIEQSADALNAATARTVEATATLETSRMNLLAGAAATSATMVTACHFLAEGHSDQTEEIAAFYGDMAERIDEISAMLADGVSAIVNTGREAAMNASHLCEDAMGLVLTYSEAQHLPELAACAGALEGIQEETGTLPPLRPELLRARQIAVIASNVVDLYS